MVSPGRHRPPREDALRRTGTSLCLRLTPCEEQHLRALVHAHGTSISHLIRAALYETYGIALTASSISAGRAVRVD